MKKTSVWMAVVLVASTLSFASAQQKKSIPETAIEAGQFKTLVEAVKAAGLLDVLSGSGPFTVLAPTDEAFKQLPEGALEELLKPENKSKLAGILKNHVAGGALTSDMAEPGGQFPTLLGKGLKVDVKGGEISVGGAKVVKADIICSNGVIHAIDKVLLPPATPVDPKKIAGIWTYVSAVVNGNKKSAESLAGQTVVITEKTWTLEGDQKFVMDYSIDGTKNPNTVSFTITESPFGGGISTNGVIKFEGDELVICYANEGGSATKFEAEANSGNNLMRLKKKQ